MNKIEAEQRLRALKEIAIYKRIISRSKWFQYFFRRNIKAQIKLIKFMYDV